MAKQKGTTESGAGRKEGKKGRPSREDRAAITGQPQPLTGPAEGARFTLLWPEDERADVEHYWARQQFYAALRTYAPVAYEPFERTGEVPGFEQFIDSVTEGLVGWCRQWLFYVGSKETLEGERVPDWLRWDMLDSLCRRRRDEPFRLEASWRGRSEDVFTDDGELAAVNEASAELRAFLRIGLVHTDDVSGKKAPRVLSRSEVMASLLERFKAFVEPQLAALMNEAEARGLGGPTKTLDDDMRRYVLKHFCGLTVREIAVAEQRGDPGVMVEDVAGDADEGAHVRGITNSIKRAATQLGVLARKDKPGPIPIRSASQRRP